MNVTLPRGVPDPEEYETAAVKVMELPTLAGFPFEYTAVVVELSEDGLIVSARMELALPLNVGLPP
jgi:hypothetical protein